MVITSVKFILFSLISLICFCLFPPKHRWISLLIASIRFYATSAGKLIVFLLLTSYTTWYAAKKMSDTGLPGDMGAQEADASKEERKRFKKETARKRKRIMMFGLIVNIGLLVFFKIAKYYSKGFSYIVNALSGAKVGDAFQIILPLGISYYTFSTVGYLLDVYWKRYDYEPGFIRFLTFSVYYPHILQGPISRYNKLGQELKKPELRIRWDNIIIGLESILLGCFKKLVIADRAAIFVSATLNKSNLGGMIYVIAMILDAVQIYADFSGYMDIVRGISRIYDVELEPNFDHPFLSRSVPEFWRRWHMSLGSWFRDYVYYPVSLSKPAKKLSRRALKTDSARAKRFLAIVIPVYVTWILTGLWHGTGKGYIAWGVYYGTLICFSTVFSEDIQNRQRKMGIRTETIPYRLFQTVKIFVIFMGGRFLGRRMGINHRIEIVRRILFNFWDMSVFDHGLNMANFMIILFGILILVRIAVIETKEDVFTWFNKKNYIFCAAVLYILIFSVFLLGIYGEAYSTVNFMYRQF